MYQDPSTLSLTIFETGKGMAIDLATREDIVRVGLHLRPKPIGRVIRVIHESVKIWMNNLVFVRPVLTNDLGN
jgi:hypothetical protein